MARRKNILDQGELAILEKETKSYVESFREAIDLFVKDCELRLWLYLNILLKKL